MLDRVRIKDAGGVGPTLGKLILQSGITRAEIARTAHVSETSLKKWVAGDSGAQSYNLVNVLNALGYDMEFVRREGRE